MKPVVPVLPFYVLRKGTNKLGPAYNFSRQAILKFSRIQLVSIGLLIIVGLGTACATTQTPVPSPDLDATVTANIQTALPDRTPTPTVDVYATIQAQVGETIEAATITPQPGDTPLPSATPTLQSVVASVRPSVVRIVTDLGAGSGFIVQMGFPTPGTGDSAVVLTNYHVIENAEDIKVTVNDSRIVTGTLLGIDPFHDLAALKICCGQFQALELVETDDPPVGSRAIVFGYPVGIPGAASITEGIVSATRYEGGQWVIQSGAATSAGDSGGPLLSLSGAVLGINTYRPDEGAGFAISQKTLLQRIPDLISGDLLAVPTPTPRPTATPTPLSLLEEGQRLFDLGLFDAAIVEFSQAIINDTEFGQAYAWRGRSYFELGRFQDAIADLSQAVLRDTTDPNFYRWRGDSYTGLNIFTPAIFDYGQAIAKDFKPTAADYHGLGFARLQSGEYWQAIDDFTQAILLEPTAERFEFRGASYFQSAADILTNQLLSAISDFDQAIRLEPTASRYDQRGDTYFKLGLDVKAQSDWDEACILDTSRC